MPYYGAIRYSVVTLDEDNHENIYGPFLSRDGAMTLICEMRADTKEWVEYQLYEMTLVWDK